MSQSSADQPIIPLDLKIETEKGREELSEIIKGKLIKHSLNWQISFSSRIVLRMAWSLDKQRVKNQPELDRFYFYWLRVLTLSVTLNFIRNGNNKSVKDISDAVLSADEVYASTSFDIHNIIYATYTACKADYYAANIAYDVTYTKYVAHITNYVASSVITVADATLLLEMLNSDLLKIINGNAIIHTPLWSGWSQIDSPPNLEALDPFWNDYLFSPALNGTLYKTDKDKLFFEGFLALPDEVLETKSAKAMQAFIEDYINKNGKLETTQYARLIFLGNGGAGKTSLVKKLFNESLNAYEKATPRIQVRDLPIKDEQGKDIHLSLWDFGGQVIMHSTHSFFISSRSTYIVACNQRANEQPDLWLRLLQSRAKRGQKMTVLVVYTHCDTDQPKDHIAPWRKDNTLKRQFKNNFDLGFFDIDLDPNKDKHLDFFPLKEEIESRAMIESKTPMTEGVNAVKAISEQLEKDQQPFITHQNLVEKLGDHCSAKDSHHIFRTANNYGYIFPERPLKDNERVNDDFIWISQKHWLTYGVYRLINNHSVVNNYGVLTPKIIREALLVDKLLFINKQGDVVKKGEKDDEEKLLYTQEGVEILKRVLIHYRWAMSYGGERHDELLLPLATRLDEPLDLVLWSDEYDQLLETDAESTLLINVELVNKPSDFFFKLATYLEPHLRKIRHLWRTGAILHFYGSDETKAMIEMPDNVLSLKVMGEDRESFQQLLLINIKETLKSYGNISAHSTERIWLGDGKSEMLSSDVIASLTSGEGTIQRIKNQLIERGRNMGTININGNVTGNVGDNNTFKNKGGINNQANHYDASGKELIGLLQKLSADMPKGMTKEKQSVNESIAGFEQSVKATDESEKQSLFKKAAETAKDIVALEKVTGLGFKYIPLISAALASLL